MGLQWRRVFRIFPVRFTHGLDGYLRGCPGSQRDLTLPKWGSWFSWVDRAEGPFGTYYRPGGQPDGCLDRGLDAPQARCDGAAAPGGSK